jgi:hypothetical protein
MADGRRPHWIGALIGTPILVAAVPPVAARASVPVVPAASASADPATLAAVAALKSQLLSITPAEKLAISGDRLGTEPALSLAAAAYNGPVGSFAPPDRYRGRVFKKPMNRISPPVMNHGSKMRTLTPMNRISPPVMNHGSRMRTRTPMIGPHKPNR